MLRALLEFAVLITSLQIGYVSGLLSFLIPSVSQRQGTMAALRHEPVSALIEKGQQEFGQSELKSALQLDKSAISRRVADALDGGFLKNLEDRKGVPPGS